MNRTVAMIVDDSPTSCMVLEGMLNDLGFEAATETDIGRALKMLGSGRVRVVFLDMMMPETPGWAFGDVIRSYCRERSIPIVFISGTERERLAHLAWKHQASGYLSKPFTEDDLSMALAALVDNCGCPGRKALSRAAA